MATNLSVHLTPDRSMDRTSFNVFRGSKAPRSEEHDFCFAV